MVPLSRVSLGWLDAPRVPLWPGQPLRGPLHAGPPTPCFVEDLASPPEYETYVIFCRRNNENGSHGRQRHHTPVRCLFPGRVKGGAV